MNKIRETLRLIVSSDMSNRMIATAVNLSHVTVGRYRELSNKIKLDSGKLSELNDAEVDLIVKSKHTRVESKCMPDWNEVNKEMQYRGVTLQLLWEDYCLANPEHAYGYSQFTHYYRQYVGKLDLTMRQEHRAGEICFVDFAGQTVPYYDAETGNKETTQIFVATLGCSNYAFAYAVKSQAIPYWIEAHNKMFEFFGGQPQIVVPDNLKSAVIRGGNEPQLNRTYLEMAIHYNVVIIPARVRKPQDKSKAELTVKFIYRWILAKFRHRKFFSVDEINVAIAELLKQFNERPFSKLPGCRYSRFVELDKPLLKELPTEPFEYAQWTSKHKISADYHMRVNDHYYSVPHELVGLKLEARISLNTVELFHQGKRVASHLRSDEVGGHTTKPEHQPIAHRKYAEQTPQMYVEWSQSIGPAAEAAINYQFENHPHKLLSIRSCNALKRLAKDYSTERFEAACIRAQKIGSLTTKSIKSILQRGLDDMTLEPMSIQVNLPLHENLRGANYYASGDC